MKKGLPKPPKAYKDLQFLNSPSGRTIRLLAEYLEPQQRFRSQGVKDTIVFFGSARVKPRTEAEAVLKIAERKMKKNVRPTKPDLLEFRSAQQGVDMSRYYEDCLELSRLLTQWSLKLPKPNRFVLCSGGGPGIMEATNRGAHVAGGKSIGLNVSLPFEQFANGYITKELNFEFHYFFMRKFWFVYLAKAMVVFPGGFGTMDEMMEVLTLVQTEKLRKKITIVLYGGDFWKKIINFDEMVAHGVISQEDLNLFQVIDTPQAAFTYLKKSLKNNYGDD